MVEAPEHLAFTAEALLPLQADPARMQELDGNGGFESIVNAPGTPNAAHAASTNLRLDDIRADVASNQGRPDEACVGEQRLRQKFGIPHAIALGKRIGNCGGELRTALRERSQPRRAV